jgi:hypothetical protein
VLAYFVALFVEYEWGSYPSMIAFLLLYFVVLWVAWVIAVRVTLTPNFSHEVVAGSVGNSAASGAATITSTLLQDRRSRGSSN